jgi:hypothetical protein
MFQTTHDYVSAYVMLPSKPAALKWRRAWFRGAGRELREAKVKRACKVEVGHPRYLKLDLTFDIRPN